MGRSKSLRVSGFTLTEFLVIAAIIAILAVLYLESRPRLVACILRTECVSNLKGIGLGFRQWALDNSDKYPDQVSITNRGASEFAANGNLHAIFMVMSNELNTPKVLVCPEDKGHTIATTFATSVSHGSRELAFTGTVNISYFAALDADETQPQMWLTGDSNLEAYGIAIPNGLINLQTNAPIRWDADRHKHQGNIGLADGSVQGYSDVRMRASLVATGHATNRLVFP